MQTGGIKISSSARGTRKWARAGTFLHRAVRVLVPASVAMAVVVAGCASAGTGHKATSTTSATTSSTTSTSTPVYGIAAGCCIQWSSSTLLNRLLDGYQAVGAKWIRFDFTWSDIQSGGPNSYNWTNYENVVNGATSRGLQVLGVLAY